MRYATKPQSSHILVQDRVTGMSTMLSIYSVNDSAIHAGVSNTSTFDVLKVFQFTLVLPRMTLLGSDEFVILVTPEIFMKLKLEGY